MGVRKPGMERPNWNFDRKSNYEPPEDHRLHSGNWEYFTGRFGWMRLKGTAPLHPFLKSGAP